MEIDIIDNNKIFLERIEFYKKLGLDQIREREFVLRKSLPVNGRILEVGTGKGHFSLVLAKNGYSFTTIDVDKQAQDIARMNLAYYKMQDFADFRIENACALNFPDNSFDVIFCIHVYHHLAEPLRVLEEMVRVLHPGGKIVLGDFSQAGMSIINKCHDLENRHHDDYKNNIDETIEFFTNKGFCVSKESNLVQELIIARAKEQ